MRILPSQSKRSASESFPNFIDFVWRLRSILPIADGIMMSDVTLPRLEESITAVKEGLAENGRSMDDFHVNNLYAWHIKETREEAIPSARHASVSRRIRAWVRLLSVHSSITR